MQAQMMNKLTTLLKVSLMSINDYSNLEVTLAKILHGYVNVVKFSLL